MSDALPICSRQQSVPIFLASTRENGSVRSLFFVEWPLRHDARANAKLYSLTPQITYPPLTTHLRPATTSDAPLILHFITELAVYEKAEHEVVATVADIEASLFSDASTATALICEMNGEPIGFCVYFFSYSTWLGKKGLYLEDLYVSPKARGSGAGKLMLRHLAAIPCETGCGRFEWSVLDWNAPAIGFYESIGASAQSEWVRYRLAGEALKAFAAGDTSNASPVAKNVPPAT
ncbi:GNAT superfamily N-acetyltransferase [Burkholderia sp. OAS925]|nr:GNAT superfamily N-acetyltransferase [Paraburkholderia graminis]